MTLTQTNITLAIPGARTNGPIRIKQDGRDAWQWSTRFRGHEIVIVKPDDSDYFDVIVGHHIAMKKFDEIRDYVMELV